MTRVVVLGGGFAGIETVRRLGRAVRDGDDVPITLVSDRNDLLFIPLLPQAAGRPQKTIEFEPQGMLVSLGEHDAEPSGVCTPAVVEGMGARLSGYAAWLFWNAVHLWKLVGFRKQLQVTIDRSLAQHFPRDAAIMRQPRRCPVCAETLGPVERRAA